MIHAVWRPSICTISYITRIYMSPHPGTFPDCEQLECHLFRFNPYAEVNNSTCSGSPARDIYG